MPRKLGSTTTDTLADLKTALDRLLAATHVSALGPRQQHHGAGVANIKNLEEEIRQAERRYASQLRLGPASEQAQLSSRRARAQLGKEEHNS